MLLDSDGHTRITDFGFAKVIKRRTFTLCGTPDYLAPEIILNRVSRALIHNSIEVLVGCYPPIAHGWFWTVPTCCDDNRRRDMDCLWIGGRLGC